MFAKATRGITAPVPRSVLAGHNSIQCGRGGTWRPRPEMRLSASTWCYNDCASVLNRPCIPMVLLVAGLALTGACATGSDDSYASNQHPVDGGIQWDASQGGSTGAGGGFAGNGGGDSGTGGGVAGSGGASGSGGGFAGNAGASGDCTDGEEQQYGTCGKCGQAIQKCVSGSWGPVECMGEGECQAGASETQACGTGGTQTRACTAACEWDAWGTCTYAGPCNPGAQESEACGNCGTHTRTCDATGQWGAWGTCQNEGVCMAGQTETQTCGNCGTKTRSCNASCQWDAFSACTGEGVCTPGQSSTADCGNCGTKSRTCTGSCQWGAYTACGGEGECSPGSIGTNCMCSGTGPTCCGNNVCNNSCQWECKLKAGKQCNWEAGTNWRCCGTNSWQFCLSSCMWSTDCAGGCSCGC